MRRIAAITCLVAAAALLPLQAEAARFRLGGRSSAPAAKVSRGIIVIPGAAAASRTQAASNDQPQRVPFPPSSAKQDDPLPLRLSTNGDDRKPWCGTQLVVGGFCMMN
ncbi:hypothetical protein [Bosea sp. TAB14]|jgi:hypothetical protein|uniref:hypothetical protein n=1 Tax=Bosea sp. TAB14 TaxID=3237481 RepID=UPI003F8EA3F7